MLALCACSASCRRRGPATELISADRSRSLGSCRACTSRMRAPWSVTSTWTSPYRFVSTAPSTTRRLPVAAAVVGGGDAVDGGEPVAGVSGGVTGVVGCWVTPSATVPCAVWKLARRINAKTVAMKAGRARRIGSPGTSVREPFGMDLAAWHAEPPEAASHGVDQAGRSAHEDVAFGDVGHQAGQGLYAELVGPVVADVGSHQHPDRDRPFARQSIELVPEHDVALPLDAVQQHDVDALRRQLVHQGADGRDADATGDQQHLRPRHPVAGEGPVGPFGEDARSPRDAAHLRREVSQLLDGDPE